MPAVDPAALGGLLMPAVSIATLAAIESLLSARVATGMVGPDGRPSGPYSPDRELTGQGLASIAAGFFGGMPATGAIARTAVNVRSGAKTRLSAVVTPWSCWPSSTWQQGWSAGSRWRRWPASSWSRPPAWSRGTR
jgi:SulP family sulfate permease